MKNIKFVLAELAILAGFFWVGGVTQVSLYVLSIIIIITALKNFCPLQKVCPNSVERIDTLGKSRTGIIVTLVLIGAIAVAGSYGSAFFTKKFFLNDFNLVNNYYKQTLFLTGQDKRSEAIKNYDLLTSSFSTFQNKYDEYQPYVLRNDGSFGSDLERVHKMIAEVGPTVTTGDLHEAHVALEAVRPVFQDILKRNNFSLLGVALVNFHDAMEKVIEAADAKDATRLLEAYPDVDVKLKAVEEIANDTEIVAIRIALEAVATSARNGELDVLPEKAASLKSAFVKVYLKRG